MLDDFRANDQIKLALGWRFQLVRVGKIGQNTAIPRKLYADPITVNTKKIDASEPLGKRLS